MPRPLRAAAFPVAGNAGAQTGDTKEVISLTKRFLGYGIAAAAAVAFALPAAPAQASECWSWFTTPVQCAEETVRGICPIEGTRPTCLEHIST